MTTKSSDRDATGKYFALILNYFHDNIPASKCYALYEDVYTEMGVLLDDIAGSGRSQWFRSKFYPPDNCRPYKFICKKSDGSFVKLPEEDTYYFGTQMMEWGYTLDPYDGVDGVAGVTLASLSTGYDCDEQHYYYTGTEWIVNGGPTINNTADIYYYHNGGTCRGCQYISALECLQACILSDFDTTTCNACGPTPTSMPSTPSIAPTKGPTGVTSSPTNATPGPTPVPTSATPGPTDSTPAPTDATQSPTLETSDPTPAPTDNPQPAPTMAPTIPPTQAPTPRCPNLMVDIISATSFDATAFEGLYVYMHGQSLQDRPVFRVPQIPQEKYIRYKGGQWQIITADGTALRYRTSTIYPPYDNQTSGWTHSEEDGSYEVFISCVESFAPIAAPTSAPTSAPVCVHMTMSDLRNEI